MGQFYSDMTPEQVDNFLDFIGYEEAEAREGTSFRAIPAVLIPIGKFLIGTAGAVIISEVMKYGIVKACQNLEGRYAFFTDFCRTNGHI